MPNFLDQLGGIGSNIIETVGDLTKGIGDNFTTDAALNKATVDRINVNNAIALQKAQTDIEAKKAMQKTVQYVVFTMLAIAGLYAAVKIFKELK